MKSNYHTHNFLCGHAKGNVRDYVLEAIKNNFDILGLSDHGPLPNPPFYRMTFSEFKDDYLVQISKAKEEFNGQIKLYTGLEIEYVEDLDDYYKTLLKDCDYLILGCHYYSSNPENLEFKPSGLIDNEEKLEEYVSLIERALDTKFFKILAHPDMFMKAYKVYDEAAIRATKRIIEACKRNNVLLEMNANGMRNGKFKSGLKADFYPYPYLPFWEEVSKYNLEITVGSDCHDPKLLDDSYFEEALKLAESLNLKIKHNIFG